MQRKIILISLLILVSNTVGAQKGQEFDRKSAQYEQTATKLVNRGERDKAMNVLTLALKGYPEHPGLNYLMGKCYYQKNNYAKARFYLVRTVRYENDNMGALALLTNIEERTGNYSSAICYINEMLVQTPYNKSLWLKKIGLYRKQGNTAESNQLLKRLAQIFPNDTDVKNRYFGLLEENVKSLREKGQPYKAIDAMKELVHHNPHNVSYYLQLANLLIQSGQSDEALNVCSQGLYFNPGSTSLIEKKVSLLSEKHRIGEAYDCLKEFQKNHFSSQLVSLEHELEENAAQDALRNDAYVMYGKIYERTHSADAFHFLLNTAISRSYINDALYYIGIAKKTHPNDATLLWKEFTIYQQLGDRQHAKPLLEKIVRLQPRNRDAVDALCAYQMDDATNLMASMDYHEAIPLLDFVIKNSKDQEQVLGAYNKKYTCLFETKQFQAAEKLLVQIKKRYPNYSNFYLRQSDLLVAQHRYPEALSLLGNILNKDLGSDQRANYLSEYEDIAVKYIHQLQTEGAVRKALATADTLLQFYPSSKLGLTYALNNSALLKDSVTFDEYCHQAIGFYPDDINFKIKLADSYQRQQQYENALNLLRPSLFDYSNDSTLIGAFSENSRLLAESYIHHHQSQKAIAVLDTALVYDGSNRSLLYDKGLAYEALHEYDSAHFYQKFYQPSLLEAKAFEVHLEQLQQKGNTNLITVNYLSSRYGDSNTKTSKASIAYTKKSKRDSYTFQLNYAGRDGASQTNAETYSPGGTGIQVQGQWEHAFDKEWNLMINGAVSTQFFPRLTFNAQLDKNLEKGWTANLHAGYRRISSYTLTFAYDEDYNSWSSDGWSKSNNNMFNFGAGVLKTWEMFSLGGKVDAIDYASSLRYSAVVNAYYYPMESRILTFSTMAGISNAPQTEILDAALPGTFDKVNTSIGFGINYQLIQNVTLAINGTWSTFANTLASRTAIPVEVNGEEIYNEYNYQDTYASKYKNLFSIDSFIIIGF